eukprot:11267582-Prorocentrum_lima.AAC.1
MLSGGTAEAVDPICRSCEVAAQSASSRRALAKRWCARRGHGIEATRFLSVPEMLGVEISEAP